ncbi:MAG: hypothetical protein MI743_16115 [Sneathiellales bacterium]|nr:hypothetical protein [Sneathiellales bacterium]
MLRSIIVVFSLFMLTVLNGCTGAAVAVIDEKISQMTEMECTSVNMMFGEAYCKDKSKKVVQEPLYCYKTLGGIDCYSRKNPYETEKSERVRSVSELGSDGAKVEIVKKDDKKQKPIFNWPFVEARKASEETD